MLDLISYSAKEHIREGQRSKGRKIIPEMTSNGPNIPEMTSNGPDGLIMPAAGRSPIGHGPGNDHVSCKKCRFAIAISALMTYKRLSSTRTTTGKVYHCRIWSFSIGLLYSRSERRAVFNAVSAVNCLLVVLSVVAFSQRCHNLSQLTCMLFATVPKQVQVAEITSIFSEKAQKLLISQLKIGEFLCKKHQKEQKYQ